MVSEPRTLVVFQVATEEDMLEVLREFAVDFLLKGYFILLTDIHKHLTKCKESLDSSYKYKQNYGWLIYYFFPLASQMEISIQQIPLTYEVVHYLTGESIFCILKILSSSIEACIDEFEVIKEFVKAQRQFFETLSTYDKTEMTKVDSFHHKLILLQVVHTKTIRQLYVLLIRLTALCGKPSYEYLSNLVVGNHVHLTTIQETLSSPSDVEFDMSSHIKQFSTVEMMRPFGQLLEKFRENSIQVNDCIFTMMHHVAGDLNCPQALDVRPIPETLTQLSTTEMQGKVGRCNRQRKKSKTSILYNLQYSCPQKNVKNEHKNLKSGKVCDDWKDLIEYMINYFRFRKRNFKENSNSSLSSNTSPNNKGTQTMSIKSDTKASSSGNNASSSSENRISPLKFARNQQIRTSSEASSNKVDDENPSLKDLPLTRNQYSEAKEGEREKDGGNETEAGNSQVIKNEKSGVERSIKKEGNEEKSSAVDGKSSRENQEKDENHQDEESAASMIAFPSPTQSSAKSSPHRSPTNNTSHVKKEVVRSLVATLRRDRQDLAISWVQESLLDAWKVRLTPLAENSMVLSSSNNQLPLEPLACYHIHHGIDIPLIAWSKEHARILRNKVFLQLLSELGLQVGDNPTRNFPSIPRAWMANDLLELAMLLGPPTNEKQYPELLGTEYAAKLVQCIMVPGQIL